MKKYYHHRSGMNEDAHGKWVKAEEAIEERDEMLAVLKEIDRLYIAGEISIHSTELAVKIRSKIISLILNAEVKP